MMFNKPTYYDSEKVKSIYNDKLEKQFGVSVFLEPGKLPFLPVIISAES